VTAPQIRRLRRASGRGPRGIRARTLGLRPESGLALFALACGGGGGERGPTTPPPPPPPVVDRVTPVEARAGESVTVEGSGFGADAGAVTVTFRGQAAAAIASVAPTAIRATVADLAPGDAPVVVTVAGRASDPVGFRVLASPPVLESVSPNPVRAGDTLTIRGRNLAAAVAAGARAPRPHQAGVRVTIDGVEIEIVTVSPGEIRAIPDPGGILGATDLRVHIDDLASDPFPIEIRFPNVGGSYIMVFEVTGNTCPTGAAAGSFVPYPMVLIDVDGEIDGWLNGSDLEGDLDLDTGAIELSLNRRFANNWQLLASPTVHRNEGEFGLLFREDAGSPWSFRREDTGCEIVLQPAIGDRWLTAPLPILDTLYTFEPIQGGMLPDDFEIVLLDPLVLEPVGRVGGGSTGTVLNLQGGAGFPHHVGAFGPATYFLDAGAAGEHDLAFGFDTFADVRAYDAPVKPWFVAEVGEIVFRDPAGGRVERIALPVQSAQQAITRREEWYRTWNALGPAGDPFFDPLRVEVHFPADGGNAFNRVLGGNVHFASEDQWENVVPRLGLLYDLGRSGLGPSSREARLRSFIGTLLPAGAGGLGGLPEEAFLRRVNPLAWQ